MFLQDVTLGRHGNAKVGKGDKEEACFMQEEIGDYYDQTITRGGPRGSGRFLRSEKPQPETNQRIEGTNRSLVLSCCPLQSKVTEDPDYSVAQAIVARTETGNRGS
ncbi:hypothetical protein MRB53_009217 [Persea americana]|uniref:Uncharacterized protein n=1 Tax=Persea americana TaxID=3435 RepID=A0ACC2LND1_PERAE|nr:hypothetical protein MRB53_009217 [Persea americana]